MKLYLSRIWLHKRFVQENKTIADMAKEAKVTEMTIRRMLDKHGIK